MDNSLFHCGSSVPPRSEPTSVVLDTDRCRLRPPCADDRHSFVALMGDPEVRRFLGGALDAATINERFANRIMSDKTCWVVVRKADDAFIGTVKLSLHHDAQDIEVSYQFLPGVKGCGYATESVRRVIDYALQQLRLPRIVAETQIANTASRRLLERLGMLPDRELERFGAKQIIYVTPPLE